MSGRMTQEEFARVFGEDNLKFFKQEPRKEITQEEINIKSVSNIQKEMEEEKDNEVDATEDRKKMKKRNGRFKTVIKKSSITENTAGSGSNNASGSGSSVSVSSKQPSLANKEKIMKSSTKDVTQLYNNKIKNQKNETVNNSYSNYKFQNEKTKLSEEDFEKEMTNLLQTIYRFVSVSTDYKFQVMINVNNLFTLNRIKHYPSMYSSICFNVNINNYKDEISEALKIKKDVFIFVEGSFIEKSSLREFYKTVNKLSVTSGNYCDKQNEENTTLNNNLNNTSIKESDSIKNFIRIKDYSSYTTKARLLLSIKNLQNDLIIIDPYYNKGHYFMPSDIEFMKYKKGNKITKRFIYAYLNVRKLNKQSKYYSADYAMTDNENSEICDIKFWNKEWYNVLCGNSENSYISNLIKYGYDGIFVDGIEDD